MKKYIIMLACFFLTMLGGCNHQSVTQNNSTQPSFTDFKGIEREYLNSLSKLEWPAGTDLPTKLEGETADRFQVGYGDTRASLLWEYTWEKEWLDTYNDDEQRSQKALSMLEKAPSMGYMSPERSDDATRNYFKEIMAKAKLGDPSGIEENLRANASR